MQDFACDGKSLDSFQFFSTFLDVAMICSARWHCSVCYSAAVIHEVCHLCNVREVQQHRVHVWVLMSLFISHQDCTDYWTSKGAKWTRNTGTLGRVWNLLWRLDHWRLVKWCFLVFISFHTISTHLKHQNAGLWLNVTNVTAAARSAGTFLVLVRFCAPVTVASEKGLQSQILASQKWYQA